MDKPEYVNGGAYQSESEQSKISAYQSDSEEEEEQDPKKSDSEQSNISAYQSESEEEEEQDPKNETTEIIGRLDGLAHDLDVGVRGVSTPCKDTPTRRGNLFPEENAVIKSNNALPKLSIDTHIESNQASLYEPPAAPNTVFGRLGAMISPAAKAGIAGAFVSPRVATFIQRVSTRKTKGLSKSRA